MHLRLVSKKGRNYIKWQEAGEHHMNDQCDARHKLYMCPRLGFATSVTDNAQLVSALVALSLINY